MRYLELIESVSSNYLYYSVENVEDAKKILSSGVILGNNESTQLATTAQIGEYIPVISVGRNIAYQVSGLEDEYFSNKASNSSSICSGMLNL